MSGSSAADQLASSADQLASSAAAADQLAHYIICLLLFMCLVEVQSLVPADDWSHCSPVITHRLC